MKSKLVKYFALPAMVMAAFLASCGSVSSDDDEEDELALSSTSKSSSSNKKGDDDDDSSSSVKDSIVDAAKDTSSLEQTEKLTTPGGVSAVRLAPSIWMLNWTFDNSGENGEGFVIQRLSPKATAWEDFGKVSAGVTHKLLEGELKGNYYYRVATYSKKSRSAYTSEVFVSENTPYDEGLEFVVPSVTANVIQDSIMEIVLTGGFPGQTMEKSPYNYDSTGKKKGEVYYEARFVYGSSYVVDTVKASVDKSSIVKKFKNLADQCNAFAQVRTVWKDRNGVKDFSDWTNPIGTKSGTEDGLVDPNKRCSEVVSTSEGVAGFASPSDLTASQLSDGTWIIEWSYTPLPTRLADGFVVQKLDLKKSVWNDLGKTGEGVTRYPLGAVTEEYSYYRVAAFDEDGRSAFSLDVVVAPSKAATVTLASPASLALDSPEDTVVMLSWTYADVGAIKGFVVQKLNQKDNKWTTEKSLDKSILLYDVKTSEYIRYFRVGAFNNSDTSFSASILVPSQKKANAAKVALATPTNLQVNEVSEGNLVLSWNYTNVPEHSAKSFVVQELNVVTGEYTDLVTIEDISVLRTSIGTSDAPRYVRVVALDGVEDGVANSQDLLIPAYEKIKAALPAPTSLAVSEIDESNLQLSWKYAASAQRPNDGFKIEILNDSYEWESVGFAKANVKMFKVSTDEDKSRYFRVSAYDVDGTDTTFASSEEILVPAYKVDRTLASPLNLTASVYQMTQYLLSWNYTDNVHNKATGFELQELQLMTNNWKKVDGTTLKGTSVTRLLIDAPASMTFYRVVAIAGTDTTYSNDISITPSEVNYEIGTPKNFEFTEYGEMQFLFSWNFEDNVLRPITGFVVQSFDGVKWVDIADSKTKLTGGNINHYVIDNPSQVTYYRLIAYAAANATAGLEADTTYSNEVIVSPYNVNLQLPAPTNLKAARVAPSIWELSWDYEPSKEHPATKFVLESSKLKDFEWNMLAELENDVMYYNIANNSSGESALETYYRVAAKDKDGVFSEYSNVFQLTLDAKYRSDVALVTPKISGYMITRLAVSDAGDTSWIETRIEVVASGSQVTKNIVNSDFTDEVTYEVRWFTATEDGSENSGESETIAVVEDQPAFEKTFTSDDGSKLNLMDACNYYAQVRAVWKDTNGGSDYSEWSDPIIFKELSTASICK